MSESRYKCINKSCSISDDDERMISCWLCQGLCHYKCSGLKTLVAESVHSIKGLKWCCNECQKIDVEFFRFFQSTKNTFLNLKNKLSALSSEFDAYVNLFDDFKQLKNLQTPELSPKRRKSARNKNKPSSEPVIPQNIPETDPLVDHPISYSSIVKSNSNKDVPKDYSNVPDTAPCNSNSIKTDAAPCNSNSINTLNQNLVHHDVHLADPLSASSSTINNAIDITAPKPLVVIPSNKYIFVSRLAFDTTVEDVKYYLNTKLGSDINFSINKFSYSQPRSITSFKIAVPPEIYEQVVSPSFWPTNIFVREYLFRETPRRSVNIVNLPTRNVSASKN